MTIQDILAGESKYIEFKESLPEKSIKYMKTVVAFANGIGGRIIFGIADETHEVVGIANDVVFKMMDTIANAISDSCEPAIIPDITLQTIEERTIICVEISEGRQRPYYIKALGKEKGVYVRIGATTRQADESIVRELSFEGNNVCFDKMLCRGLQIAEPDIQRLCRYMKDEAQKNARSDELRESVRNVGIQQLLSWGVLIEQNGTLYPTNAYAILTGCDILPTAIQCALFKGTTKAIFVDRREYRGPIWEQIEQAYLFVLRNIHLGATLKGIYRQDIYEIPPDAIRELIINAVVHRSYLDHGNIQIAIYDDRLEVLSPGKLPMGQTLERMKQGYSRIRNEALASAFSYMNLIEHWGSGIPRIIEIINTAGLRPPEFIGGDIDLKVNIYRDQSARAADNTAAHEPNDLINDPVDPNRDPNNTGDHNPHNYKNHRGKDDREGRLLEIIRSNPSITQKDIARLLSVSAVTVKRTLAEMQKRGVVARVGSNRSGKKKKKNKM